MAYVSGYYRRQRNGRRGYVSGYLSDRQATPPLVSERKPRLCPECGAPIRIRGMRSGKLVTYEARDGLRSVKHPCCHLGEELSKTRDGHTPDMFEQDGHLALNQGNGVPPAAPP